MLSFNDPENIWFISDTHFGHCRIRTLCNRPFNSLEEMDEYLIDQWNSKVKPKDWVIHLGDFAYRNEKSIDYYRKRLNGNIIIVKGNHDEFQNGQVKHLFSEVYDYLEIRIKDEQGNKQGWQHIVCFHYPIWSFKGFHGGNIHVYGHVHNDQPPLTKAVNCCVEHWNYSPISYEQIKSKIIAQIQDAEINT